MTMKKLTLPRLTSAADTGLVLDLARVDTLMPGIATSWVTTTEGEEFELPVGLLQFWALEVTSRGLQGPMKVEFGVLPNGRAYAEILADDAASPTESAA